jgi:hypothetical protein
MTKGQISPCNCISEIGIVGYFISKDDQIIKNEVAGYLLRTKVINLFLKIQKNEEHNEGGIVSGCSVIDSIAIVK